MKNTNNLLNIIEAIDARMSHLEDIEADNRALLVKLIKQNNEIVQFLKSLEIEEVIPEDEFLNNSFERNSSFDLDSEKMMKLKQLLDTFMEKSKDLKELEKELKKNKDQLTPGVVGES